MEKITLHTKEVYEANHLLNDFLRSTPDYRAVFHFIKNIVKEVQAQMDCVSKTNSCELSESFAEFEVSLPVIDNEKMYCHIRKNAREWNGCLSFQSLFKDGVVTDMTFLYFSKDTSSIIPALPPIIASNAIYERLIPYVKKFPEMAEKSDYDFTNVLIESINRNILDPVQEKIKNFLHSIIESGRMREYLEADGGCISNPFDYLEDIGFSKEEVDALYDSLDAEEQAREEL